MIVDCAHYKDGLRRDDGPMSNFLNSSSMAGIASRAPSRLSR